MMLARWSGLVALSLAGCTTSVPAPALPPAELPARWSQAVEPATDAVTAGWWRAFGSAELDGLVAQAMAQSLDLDAAAARVRQAQAMERLAGAALLPNVAAGAEAGRVRSSQQGSTEGNYGLTLSAQYEVDFWGRNAAGRDAARASRQASAFDRDTVRLTVTAGVASAWLRAVGLRERIAIAGLNLDSAERLLALVSARVRAGAATPLELAQQRALVAQQRRVRAALLQQADDAGTALTVLLARTQGQAVGTATLAPLRLPSIDAGLPAELLARRPDIARAEARLAAADADVVAARAAMLPRLSLTAGLSTGSTRLRGTLDHPVLALAAGLTAPIFDAGRLAAGHDLALAQRAELLALYRQAIVAAVADVDVALNALGGLQAQALAQAEELGQVQRALALAETRYRAGAETLLALLDTQRGVYAAQDAAVQLRQDRLLAAVALYKALGGGWRLEPGA